MRTAKKQRPAHSPELTRNAPDPRFQRNDPCPRRADSKFRKELLREGVECMVSGDTVTAKTILRDYINATVGFAEVAEATHIPSKSLMRMLGPTGNPRADNLFEIVSFLQNREGVRFHVKAELA